MTRYLIGLVVGATGALIGVYAAMSLLPATREERPRYPLPQRTLGSRTFSTIYRDGGLTDDAWTSGPIT
jgi:hypothetical protein